MQRFHRIVNVLVGAYLEGIEADSVHVEQLVAQYIADGAQLAGVAIAIAQRVGDRIAAPVLEGREIHCDQLQMLDIVGQLGRVFMAVQPHTQFALVAGEGVALRQPDFQRHDQLRRDRQNLGDAVLAGFDQAPVVRHHHAVANDVLRG